MKKNKEIRLQRIKNMEDYYQKENKLLKNKMKFENEKTEQKFKEKIKLEDEKRKKFIEEEEKYQKLQNEIFKITK